MYVKYIEKKIWNIEKSNGGKDKASLAWKREKYPIGEGSKIQPTVYQNQYQRATPTY